MAGKSKYERLAGGHGVFGTERVFLAADHLLTASNTLFLERYRRVYFRDLAAFSIHRNRRWLVHGLVNGGLLAFFWLVAVGLWEGSGPVSGGSVFFGLVALVPTALFVRNLALGPCCTCFVRTAVQTVKLGGLTRVRRALRVRRRILEQVRAAQGETVAPAPGHAVAPAAAAPGPSARMGPAVATASAPPAVAPTTASRRHALVALAANAVGGFLAAAGILYDYVETSAWGMLALLLGVLAAVSSAIVQLVLGRGGRLAPAARIPGLGTLAATVLGGVAAYVCLVAVIVESPELATSATPQHDPFSLITGDPPGTHAVVDFCYLAMAGLFAVLGLLAAGLWLAAARPGPGDRLRP